MEKFKQDLQNYQINSKTYVKYDTDGLNQYQNYLYKRALYGLSSLTEQELATMCNKKKQRIINVYKKAQTILNVLKQKISINYTNSLFLNLFPNSNLTASLIEHTEIDEKFKNCLTFKDLNINKTDIITIFIEEGVLPKNFLSLQEAPVNLPMLKNQSV